MITTIYTRRRREAPTVIGCVYRTVNPSPMHAHIRALYPDAQTWQGPAVVITDLIPGVNLCCMPIIKPDRSRGPVQPLIRVEAP